MSDPPPFRPVPPVIKHPLPAERTDRDVLNLVSDTVVGPNMRLVDNLVQAVSILVSMGIGSLIGVLVIRDLAAGVLVGGFCGMVLGLFASGIVLGIYRAVRHFRGKHD